MIDKQLFDRFLQNECSAEERRFVIEYLQAHPDEAADLLPEDEFEEVQTEAWNPERSNHSFRRIQQRLEPRTRPLIQWSLVAATILVAIVGVKWLVTGPTGPAQKAQEGRMLADKGEWVTENNSSSQTRMLLLPDGSSAELSPGSQISYRRTFTSDDRRWVKLTGEGQFKVVGDPRRPFTVISGELTTTVLGTWFSVIADSGSATIKVHLYSGSVKIGASDGIHWKTKDSALFLRPGEELTYNKQNMLAVIRSLQHPGDRNLAKAGKAGPRTTSLARQLSAHLKPEWYMFGGQSLTEVFDQLSDYYGVQINYFPSDVANRYFTGKFSKTDSLEDILNDIALLHDLTLTKTEGMYVFRKKGQ